MSLLTNIAAGLQKLRQERNLSQAELAKVLEVSQPTLSLIENGKGSLTAEQFLKILQHYNLSLDYFLPKQKEDNGELQNALVRFGATHLRETENALPSQRYKSQDDLILEILTKPLSSRHLTALAPLFVKKLHNIIFQHLSIELQKLGLERRLLWFLECLIPAIEKHRKDNLTRSQKRDYRLANSVIPADFRNLVEQEQYQKLSSPREDILIRTLSSPQSLAELKAKRDAIAKKWQIITDLTTDDLYKVLVEADENDR